MAITVMNGAQEIESLINPPAETNLKRDAEGRFISPKAEPEVKTEPVKTETIEEDDTPEWVKRGNFSKEQHDIVTDVIKRSIGKKHAQAKEAEEFAEQQYNERQLAIKRAEALERENERLKQTIEPPKPKDELKKPDRTAFESDEAYIEAVADWKTEQKLQEREAQQAKEREQARIEKLREAATARINAARLAVDDFDDVVGAADIIVPDYIGAYMQESEMLAELGYHFAKNPQDLERLAKMPTRTALDLQRLGVAIAKIESTLIPFAQKAKPSNGAQPSQAAQPNVDDDGDLPSDTGTLPSPKPRAAAPVIQPLNTSIPQVEKRESEKSYEEARASWEKRNRRDFTARKRH